ncbi:MAG TPA: hypothetical protein VJ654_11305 [Noviherbaspirillum sp.]|nr:hypothetical protein [Noviherbaspirillum sp.]
MSLNKVFAETMARSMRDAAEVIQENRWRQAISDWEKHAAKLEQKVKNQQSQIAKLSEINAEQSGRIDILAQALQKRDAEANQTEARLQKALAEYEKLTDASKKYRTYLEEKLEQVVEACTKQSAKLAGYDEIYRLLVQEIFQHGVADRFKSLDSDGRMKVIEEVIRNFEKTGKVMYMPNLDFTYQYCLKTEYPHQGG